MGYSWDRPGASNVSISSSREFVNDFHPNRKADPTGYETLKRALGAKDMAAFKTKWEAYVLKLRFP